MLEIHEVNASNFLNLVFFHKYTDQKVADNVTVFLFVLGFPDESFKRRL